MTNASSRPCSSLRQFNAFFSTRGGSPAQSRGQRPAEQQKQQQQQQQQQQGTPTSGSFEVIKPSSRPSETQEASTAEERPLIFDVTYFNLDQEVFNSPKVVLLFFYVDWAEACKNIEPVLHNFVTQSGGTVRLARANMEQLRDVCTQLQVKQAPTLVLIHKGKIASVFEGGSYEEFRKVLETASYLVRVDITEQNIERASQMIEGGDIDGAVQIYAKIQNIVKDNPYLNAALLAGLARVAIAKDNISEAETIVERLKKDFDSHAFERPDVRKAVSTLELIKQNQGGNKTQLKDLLSRVESDANDLQARYDLSLHYFTVGMYEKAVDQLFLILKKDKHWNEDSARKQLIKIFEALGPDSKLAQSARKRLSAIWFS